MNELRLGHTWCAYLSDKRARATARTPPASAMFKSRFECFLACKPILSVTLLPEFCDRNFSSLLIVSSDFAKRSSIFFTSFGTGLLILQPFTGAVGTYYGLVSTLITSLITQSALENFFFLTINLARIFQDAGLICVKSYYG